MHIKPKLDERHEYRLTVVWTGAAQGATASYQSYSREFEYRSGDKVAMRGSADPHFRGDPSLYNPEEQLVAALSSCHMLSYLAECARAGVHVVAYADDARGVMAMRDGKLRFTEVLLRPNVTIAARNPESAASDVERAIALHHAAHEGCFIASSVNFPVMNAPTVVIAPG